MKYCYWFSNLINISNIKKKDIIDAGLSSRDVYHMNIKDLYDINILTGKDISYIDEHRKNFELDREWMDFIQKNINFVTIEQADFPERLRYIHNCPYSLFYIGHLPQNKEPVVAMVGARARSIYGREVALQISSELAKAGYSVISGLAQGIDGDSHWGALKSGGTTYGVLASGVDVCYPEKNRYIYEEIIQTKTGGVISENLPGTKAKPMFFPLRNRIISGLSDAIVIVEAREKSGSLISADYALEQGKDVFVVPGRITDALSAGCNRLIYQGAQLLLSPTDLISQLGSEKLVYKGQTNNLRKNILEKDESLVYSLLDFRPLGLMNLVDELDMNLSRVLMIIESLEQKGYIEEVLPNYFVKVL